jgi:GAF domain-containing protein
VVNPAVTEPTRPARLTDELPRLQAITAALAAAASEAGAAEVVLDQVLPAIGADAGLLAVVGEEGALRVVGAAGYGELADQWHVIPLDAGLPLSEAARTGEAVWVSTGEERVLSFPASRAIPVVHQALAALPLELEGRVEGVLGLSFTEPRAFSADDRAFLHTVAQQCAVTLDRCRLQDRERARATAAQEHARMLETLQRVGRALAGELNLERIIQTVTDAATQLSGAEFGAFFYNVIRDDGEAYMLYALSGAPAEAFADFPMPRSTAVFGPTFRGEGVIRLDDVQADPRYGRNEPYRGMPPGHLPVRSYLAVPVVARSGEVHGGLFFGHSLVGVFTERSEQLVSGLAAHAGVAIDNARLYEAEQRARAAAEEVADRLGRIQTLGGALARAVTVAEVVRVITEEAVPELGSRTRALWLVDDEGTVLRPAGAPDGESRFREIPLDAPFPAAEAVRSGAPVFVSSAAERDARFPGLATLPSRVQSFAVLPLLGEDEAIGVLSLGFDEERAFEDAERRFLVAMADQCAVTLERARLYDSERQARAQAEHDRRRSQELAWALQTSLLPPGLPDVPGLELGARYHPAMAGIDVGGDFYDVFDTGGDWAVVIGDVCGKGPEAAALTALARYTLRSVAMDLRQPAQVLRKLNEVLLRQQLDERFCTVAYARIVPTVGGVRVTVTRGGHPRPMVLRGDATVEPIGAEGGLIGLLPEIRLWEETTQLLPGDSIVLYTDGVTEAGRGRRQFGEERLAEVLRAAAGSTAPELAAAVEAAVLEFGGGQPRDDVAILALRVPPS